MRHSYDFLNYTSSAISLTCKVKMCYFLQRIGSTSNVSLSTVSAVEFFRNKHDDESKGKQTLLPLTLDQCIP